MPVAIERALLMISSIGMKYALSVYLRKLIALSINLNYNSNSYNNTNQHIFQSSREDFSYSLRAPCAALAAYSICMGLRIKKLWAWYFHHTHSHTKSFYYFFNSKSLFYLMINVFFTVPE